MAPSIDCTVSFLCSEEGSFEEEEGAGSVLCHEDEDDEEEDEQQQPLMYLVNEDHHILPLSSVDEAISALLEKEAFHVPRRDYWQRYQRNILDARARQKAVSWLLQAQAFFRFQPLTAILSVNYLDRFLSLHQMPDGKTWMYQLLSVGCLSLAAKMEETEVPLLLDLQIDGSEFIFEPRTIQRMELMVLSVLDWRLSSVTPLSYIHHCIRRTSLVSAHLHRRLITRVVEFVLGSLKDIRFLQYLPSEVAAAALLCAIEETSPAVYEECKESVKVITSSKDSLGKCIELMEETFLGIFASLERKAGSGWIVPRSPMRVLEASFSCDSESTDWSLESGTSNHVPPPTKKRRVEAFL